jgi:HPt (histidine-containing phosphotransfer) domain-containing protein
MDRYLSKPYTIDQLFRVLESCVTEGEQAQGPGPAAPAATAPVVTAPIVTATVAASPAPVLSAAVTPLPARNPAATNAVAAIPVLTNRVMVERTEAAARAAPPPPAAPPAAPALTPAPLDEKTLDQIRELQRGVPNLLAKVAEMYLENSAMLLDELRGCFAAKDVEGIARCAHAFKSTSFNMGAKDLAELCEGLENFAQQGQVDAAKSAFERVVHEHGRVALALEALKIAA